ncbi:GABA permease [Limosilactobacillus coleohominis DSM 14060]|nr:GABA permease [Limosilactobacillus coleohominis DSM 14060]
MTDIVTSPFTLVFKRAGLAAAASVMNTVILVAVLSSANSWMYASTRMLFSQAREGFAWRMFGYVNKRGIPIYGLVGTTVIGLLIWFTQFIGPQAYNYLIGASGLSGFIAWLGIAISHFRFRRAFIKQGHDVSELTYHAALFPFGPLFAFGLCIVVILCQNLDAFVKFDWQSIVVTYITIPVFIVLYLYYKLKYGSHLIPLEEVDLSRKTKGESYETEDK